ncbi:MAG: hypothetical protein OJF51_000371 [Nitrospira sp.]|nr:MAG: hypothetical protein OJF51_000371 [Nitrospira sp.]
MAPYLAPMSSKTNIVENRPGYGFVEMGSSEQAVSAVIALHLYPNAGET